MIETINFSGNKNLSLVLPENMKKKGYCIGLGEYYSPSNFSIFFDIPDKNIILMGRLFDVRFLPKIIPGDYFLRHLDDVMAIQYSRISFHSGSGVLGITGWEEFMDTRVNLTKEHIRAWERKIYYPILSPWGVREESVKVAEI